jgi:hypothetical protein
METIKEVALIIHGLFVSPQQVKAFAPAVNFWVKSHVVLVDGELWPIRQCKEVGQQGNFMTSRS